MTFCMTFCRYVQRLELSARGNELLPILLKNVYIDALASHCMQVARNRESMSCGLTQIFKTSTPGHQNRTLPGAVVDGTDSRVFPCLGVHLG